MPRRKLALISVKRSSKKPASLAKGLTSLRNRQWRSAFTQLALADQAESLGGTELEALAIAAHLSGNESQALELLARIHQHYLESGDVRRAARFAFWLGFIAFNDGQHGQSDGWLARASRLLDGHDACPERGYLLIPAGIRAARDGEIRTAVAAFLRAGEIGKQFADRDLMTMALNGHGRALIRGGENAKGNKLLDEAMIAVIAGEVSPIVAGGMYCSVLESCRETHDLSRAQEWTRALDEWCADQPELVPFRGHCLLHRAELLQLRGSWREALQEARDACEHLSAPMPKPALGSAFYRLGELHRLLGEFHQAEEAYVRAAKAGHPAQPGLALLRLAQGRGEPASEFARQYCDEIRRSRGRLSGAQAESLAAGVEIALGANDLTLARFYARTLEKMATKFQTRLIRAMSCQAVGAVMLASKNTKGALAALRRACALWSELDAPYHAARVRALAARACRELGDSDASQLECAAARETFQKLEAAPDLAQMDAVFPSADKHNSSRLSTRELEVLRLVASGAGNRAIAQSLSISGKTVARHLSNIFVKLDVASRSAATAYAFQNNLVTR